MARTVTSGWSSKSGRSKKRSRPCGRRRVAAEAVRLVWIQQTLVKPAYIDIVAVLVKTEKGASIRLSVLNRHPSLDWKADCTFAAFKADKVEVHEMYSDELGAVNTFEEPDTVVPQVSFLSGADFEKKGGWNIRKHSWTFFIFDGQLSSVARKKGCREWRPR